MKNTINRHYKIGLTQQFRNSTIVTYPEIGYKGVKKGKCNECNKPRQTTRIFYQTKSPWNVKPEHQIETEEKEKAIEWSEKKFECKCGGTIK